VIFLSSRKVTRFGLVFESAKLVPTNLNVTEIPTSTMTKYMQDLKIVLFLIIAFYYSELFENW